jgi:Zn-dependent M28 family amino/carboxypeptidase
MFGASHATQSTANIIAELPGSTKAAEIVVIGAHYDSAIGSPAANDNGSGVAALIEIARSLAKEKFARTVRFVAFTNEEMPFFRTDDMGSNRYAQHCRERDENVVSMVSVETIGYFTGKPDTQHFPVAALAVMYPTTGNFLAFVGNLESRSLLDRCAKAFNEKVKFPSEVLSAPAELAGVDFSDHMSFWRANYPAIMVTDTANYRYPHYHKKTDTPDKINYDNLARVTSGLEDMTRDLASR